MMGFGISQPDIEGILNNEEKKTSNTKVIIENAIKHAIQNGYKIKRGAVLNLANKTDCNVLGAVLIYLKRTDLVGENGFAPNFLSEMCKLLTVDESFLHRFVSGFDYGNQITFSSGDLIVKDKVSMFGLKLAKEYCGVI